jgi:hypothetical protein
MQQRIEVEEAKAIMTEGIDWSVLKWLREKKTVRKMADRANATLDASILKLKAGWDKNLQSAYEQLCAPSAKGEMSKVPPELLVQAKKLKRAEDEARQARDDAENTFDEAEKRLSTTMAREGARKAIRSWELHEHLIRLSEAAAQPAKAKA